MAASYPTSLKVFTPKADGETVFAAHVNEVTDEVAALQNALGTSPQGGAATVKARIAALETGKSDTTHNHAHNSLTGLTEGDPHTQYLRKDTGTTKGDLLAFTGAGAAARRPVGANGTFLLADSAQSTGMRWGSITETPFAGYRENLVTLPTSGTVVLDFAVANAWTIAPTGAVTITVANLPPDGSVSPGTLRITNSTYAITWPAGTRHPGGTSPALDGESWVSVVGWPGGILYAGLAWNRVA